MKIPDFPINILTMAVTGYVVGRYVKMGLKFAMLGAIAGAGYQFYEAKRVSDQIGDMNLGLQPDGSTRVYIDPPAQPMRWF